MAKTPLKSLNPLQTPRTPQLAKPVAGSVGGATGQAGGPRFYRTPNGPGPGTAYFSVDLVNQRDQLISAYQTLKQNDGQISTVIVSFAPGTYDLSSWARLPITQDVALILQAANGNPSSVTLNFFGAIGGPTFLFNIRNAIFQLVLNVVFNFNVPAAAGQQGAVIRQANPQQGGGGIEIKEGAELHVIVGAGAFGAPFGVNSSDITEVPIPFSLNECCTGCPGDLILEGAGSAALAIKLTTAVLTYAQLTDVTTCIVTGVITAAIVSSDPAIVQATIIGTLEANATGSPMRVEGTDRIESLTGSGVFPVSIDTLMLLKATLVVAPTVAAAQAINANVVNSFVQRNSISANLITITWSVYTGGPLALIQGLTTGAGIDHVFVPNIQGGSWSVGGNSTFTLNNTICCYMNNGVITALALTGIQAFATIFEGPSVGPNVIPGTALIGATLGPVSAATFLP